MIVTGNKNLNHEDHKGLEGKLFEVFAAFVVGILNVAYQSALAGYLTLRPAILTAPR